MGHVNPQLYFQLSCKRGPLDHSLHLQMPQDLSQIYPLLLLSQFFLIILNYRIIIYYLLQEGYEDQMKVKYTSICKHSENAASTLKTIFLIYSVITQFKPLLELTLIIAICSGLMALKCIGPSVLF